MDSGKRAQPHQQHNRRSFLKKASLGLAAVALGLSAGKFAFPSLGSRRKRSSLYGDSVFTPRQDQQKKT